MNLIVMLPHTADRFDPICVLVDRPTKVEHFVPTATSCTQHASPHVASRRACL
jgi:hypothetical protein